MEKPFFIVATKGESDREFQIKEDALKAFKSSPSDTTLYNVDEKGCIYVYKRK